MGRTGLALLLLGSLALLGSCSHATPQIVQVFSQTNRVFDPAEGSWSTRLSVFLQVSSSDGNKVFDRLHLIQDERQLVYTLGSDQWASVERPGEFWIGVNNLRPPEGSPVTGAWRALVVTRSGQRVETTFAVPPVPSDAPPPWSGAVAVVSGGPGRVRFSGWVVDTLIWFRDAKGAVIGRSKVVGPEAALPTGTASLELYSYDKARGEGMEAGPFPVQTAAKPADR
jgi:hypothetical protein